MFTKSSRATIHEKLTQSTRRSRGHLLFRVPLCMFFGTVLMLELVGYVWVRIVVAALEYVFARRSRTGGLGELHKQRRKATTYAAYRETCKAIDKQENREAWKGKGESPHYDCEVIKAAVRKLIQARASCDARKVMESMSLSRNYGGIMNLDLYTKTWDGTKTVIEKYVEEVTASIEWLSDADLTGPLSAERVAFLQKAKAEFGNTSLLMSGGAMLGLYHIGVVKALLKNQLLPKVISGTSAGAVIGCYVCTRTDEELTTDLNDTKELHRRFSDKGPFWGGKVMQMKNAYFNGFAYEFDNFHDKILWFTNGLTFREAHEKTGRVLNITCTPSKTKVKGHPSLMLNYITAPDVPIAHAVIASSCVPFLMEPAPIMERVRGPDGSYRTDSEGKYIMRAFMEQVDDDICSVRMRDGTFETDLPIDHMGHAFNSQFNIVSQVNPHVFPFFFNNTGEAGKPLRSWHAKGGWRGGFVLSLAELWLKEDMRKNLRILASLRLMWDVFGVDWSNLWLQESMGDITITPPMYISDFWNISVNLSSDVSGKAELDRKIETAERLTWKALPMISKRMDIQKKIDDAFLRHTPPSAAQSTRIPSTPHTSPRCTEGGAA
eukprot:TRINITY_DN8089_c5_g1_i1.p1 TRINITY_DN8089_c5_g1~~TRINITY_DN8089_c5_g1_i1.p1  ORF type:complete len:626 (+),score=96.57 TRINITY_DN8089_c5_g1_i1:61-1878(+)